MGEKILLVIKCPDDRRQVVAILADNGYSVKIDRVKVGNQMKSVVVAWKDKAVQV
jgi:hypothetical protein